jgi:hypothetical protein
MTQLAPEQTGACRTWHLGRTGEQSRRWSRGRGQVSTLLNLLITMEQLCATLRYNVCKYATQHSLVHDCFCQAATSRYYSCLPEHAWHQVP